MRYTLLEGSDKMGIGLFKYSNKTKTGKVSRLPYITAEFSSVCPGYTWGPGLRDHFLIHHVISGKGVFTVSGQPILFVRGILF